jgi:hypothetical protein
MRNESHTLIGILRHHVAVWRKREDWSRETVCQHIVEAHDTIGGPALTRIRFEPNTRDTFERSKVNADRIFRWLDDENKDNALLPANFIFSVWYAMPVDIRLECINDCLDQFDLHATGHGDGCDNSLDISYHFRDVVKESGEALLALAQVVDDQSLPSLERAEKEIGEAIEAKGRARRAIHAAIGRCRSLGGKIIAVGRRNKAS